MPPLGNRKRRYGGQSSVPPDLDPSHNETCTTESRGILNDDLSEVSSKKSKTSGASCSLAPKKDAKQEADLGGTVASREPTWQCCCQLPGNSILDKNAKDLSANCLYDITQLWDGRMTTVGELRAKQAARVAYDDTHGRCNCQAPSQDHPDHPYMMTAVGHDWAQYVATTSGHAT